MTRLFLRQSEDPRGDVPTLLRLGLHECGLPDAPLEHLPSGQPVLPGGPRVSISHSRSWAAVALSEHPLGVDVEEPRRIVPNLPRRVLSDGEYRWFTDRGSRPGDFLILWTLKESWLKYCGTGLTGFPNRTDFCLVDGLWRLPDQPQRFFTVEKDLLFAAVCCEEQEVEIRMLRS